MNIRVNQECALPWDSGTERGAAGPLPLLGGSLLLQSQGCTGVPDRGTFCRTVRGRLNEWARLDYRDLGAQAVDVDVRGLEGGIEVLERAHLP